MFKQVNTETIIDDLELPTGSEVEKELLKREETTPHALDNHAAFFALYAPKLFQSMELLSKKAILRVIELAVKHPIEESTKKALNSNERDVFNTLNQLLTSKYSMIIFSGIEEMQKEQETKEIKPEGDTNV